MNRKASKNHDTNSYGICMNYELWNSVTYLELMRIWIGSNQNIGDLTHSQKKMLENWDLGFRISQDKLWIILHFTSCFELQTVQKLSFSDCFSKYIYFITYSRWEWTKTFHWLRCCLKFWTPITIKESNFENR